MVGSTVKRSGVLLSLVALLMLPSLASAASTVKIRHADFELFPQVRVTVLLPEAAKPRLFENRHAAAYASIRPLGAADALMLAVDNSSSMRGAPLREAKRAAHEFLARERRASSTGLVAFGHEALALTRPNESSEAVSRTLMGLATDPQTGTALYDAVVASVRRFDRIPAGTKVLVLLTDGRDVGSRATLEGAIRAAQRGSVIVYAIAAGRRADHSTLARMAGETGGRLFDAGDVSTLRATYEALSRELDRTWQISYVSGARPGDAVTLSLVAGTLRATSHERVPGGGGAGSGPLPDGLARSMATAVIFVLLGAILFAACVVVLVRQRQKPTVVRLLQPHVQTGGERRTRGDVAGRLEALTAWTEAALADLPGSSRLTWSVERSGWKLRPGHVPYVALASAFALEILGVLAGAGPLLSVLLLVVGLGLPFGAFQIAATRRRKAFDRQLPDVLATIASTLRAGHGLRIALRAVADDGSPPASEEFKRVLYEERFGRPLHEAIAAMCERIGSPDLDYVATAINVQSQAGGSLASLFDTLSETVRERQRHGRKVRALTSMGRASAVILVGLPFVLAALMTLVSPSYMKPFFTTSTGHSLIVFCLVSMSIGAFLLKRIVTVKY